MGLLSYFVRGDACYGYLSRVRENLIISGNDHIGPLDYRSKTLILGAIFSSLFVALSQHPLMTSFSLVNFYLWEREGRLNWEMLVYFEALHSKFGLSSQKKSFPNLFRIVRIFSSSFSSDGSDGRERFAFGSIEGK